MDDNVSVGVEEEFHVVDLASRALVPRGAEVLERLAGGRYAAELQRSAVETNTLPWAYLGDLRKDLTELRARMVEAARELGLAPVAAGTAPLTTPETAQITAGERYEYLHDHYQLIARQQMVCGLQVHADVADRDLAVAVAQRVQPWLPVFLALTVSSPYWMGSDSGYGSSRTLGWQRWPTAGPAGPFANAAEYDQAVADLVRAGVMLDAGMIYFDVRPSAHVPTVELRVCDATPLIEDVILVAGLFRALVIRERDAAAAGEPLPPVRPALARAATWRAARYGMEGDIVTVLDPVPVPARERVETLLEELRPILVALGDWPTVRELADSALARGSSAARQRAAFAERGELADVVDLLVAETASGLGLP